MKIVILTGDQPRHKYFADAVSKKYDVPGVVFEKKKGRAFPREGLLDEELKIVDWWENARLAADRKFFGPFMNEAKPQFNHLFVETNHLNDSEIFEWVGSKNPDALCVFGTGLVKEGYINAFPNKILNMHLGISPEYRGSGTTLWPIINNDFEHLGVSIIFLDAGVDTGDIIYQGFPEITKEDDPHTIGAKIIFTGTDLMIKALGDMASSGFKARKQEKSGRQYMRKEWGLDQIRELYKTYHS